MREKEAEEEKHENKNLFYELLRDSIILSVNQFSELPKMFLGTYKKFLPFSHSIPTCILLKILSNHKKGGQIDKEKAVRNNLNFRAQNNIMKAITWKQYDHIEKVRRYYFEHDADMLICKSLDFTVSLLFFVTQVSIYP